MPVIANLSDLELTDKQGGTAELHLRPCRDGDICLTKRKNRGEHSES